MRMRGTGWEPCACGCGGEGARNKAIDEICAMLLDKPGVTSTSWFTRAAIAHEIRVKFQMEKA